MSDVAAEFTPERAALIGGVAESLIHTMKTLHRARASYVQQGGADTDAFLMLARIETDGPQRVSTLAELGSYDASVASRRVSALVKDGLLERVPDPADGRASLVGITSAGRPAVAGFREMRNRSFGQMLDDWTDDDCLTLTTLLERLTARVQHTLAADADMTAGREEHHR